MNSEMKKINMGKAMPSAHDRKIHRWRIFLTGLAFCALTGSGCSKAVPPANTTAPPTTYVVFMDLAAWSDSTEIYLNNLKVTSPVAPGGFNSTYEHLLPGVYDIQFDVAGTDSVLANIPSSSYDSMNFYTVILYNNDTTAKTASAIKILDDFTQVTTQYTYFRFLNFCSSLPPVDVYLAVGQGQPVMVESAVAANSPGNPLFQQLSPETYTIQLKKAGTDSVVFTSYANLFEAGNAYSIIFCGRLGSATFPVTLNVIKAAY